ncbi:MAG: NADH-quinone oxidoreductase subunit N [Bacteroidota bacterium]
MGALIITAILGLVLLFMGLGNTKKWLAPVAIVGLLLALGSTFLEWGSGPGNFSNMAVFDNYSLAFNGAMIFCTIIIFLLGIEYYKDMDKNVAENYSLMLLVLPGAFLMTSFTNMVVLFIGIEVLSIPLYVLSGSKRHSLRANEASFKYFVMGSFASAFLLFGITLVYGATASFYLPEILEFATSRQSELPSFFIVGVMLIFLGMTFKVAAAPLHFWSPDVYEGSPTLVTAFMSTVVKMAGFAAFYRILMAGFGSISHSLQYMLWIITFLTLIVGNFSAIWQLSFKRLLAYSSIANSGFLLLAMVPLHQLSANTVWFYSFTYSLATLIAFSVFFSVKHASGGSEQIEIFRGLWKIKPWLAFVFTIALLSLAGIPPLAGFFAKYFVFYLVISSGYTWPGIAAVVLALIGIFYYFAVLRYVFSDNPVEKEIEFPLTSSIAMAICVIMVIGMGIYPVQLI